MEFEHRQSILDAIYRRRAVRAYTAEQPGDAVIHDLIDVRCGSGDQSFR